MAGRRLCLPIALALGAGIVAALAGSAAAQSSAELEECIVRHIQNFNITDAVSKEEALKACAARIAAARALPSPRPVRAEVAERLRERVEAATDALGSCLKDARSAMEECVQSGRPPRQCRAEAAGRLRETCPSPDLSRISGGGCVAECRRRHQACIAGRSEGVCQEETLACLSECPETVEWGFEAVKARMERLRDTVMRKHDVSAMDEDRNPVEAIEGALKVVRRIRAGEEVPAAAAGTRTVAEARTPEEAPAAPARAAPGLVLSLPVRLAAGKRLAAFEHKPTGIVLKEDQLSIPMRAGPQVVAHIRAKVREAVGTGAAAEAVVERLTMETKALEADLSDERPKVGKILVKLAANLRDLPEGAEVEVTPLASLIEARKKAVEEAARREGLRVKEVAYAVEVKHENLTETVEGANVTLTVSRGWVESQGGPESVRIVREGDDGSKQVLETTFLGYDGDSAVFEGASPGLSVFSLVAIEEEASPAPTPVATPTPRQPGMEAALAVAALAAAGVVWRIRLTRER